MLTTVASPQGDGGGQRELRKGRHHTGVEPPGLPQQALTGVGQIDVTLVFLWEDLEGVFTSGLPTGRKAEPGAAPSYRSKNPCCLKESKNQCLYQLLNLAEGF